MTTAVVVAKEDMELQNLLQMLAHIKAELQAAAFSTRITIEWTMRA